MDANGAAAILMAVIMAAIGAYRQYPKFRDRYISNGEEIVSKPKPTLETLNARIETLETELREAYKDRDEAVEERDKAREQIGTLRSEFRQQIDNLQAQIDSLNSRDKQQIEDIGRLTNERNKLDADYKAILKEYNDSLKLVNSMHDEMNELEIKVESLTIDNKAHRSLDVLVDEFGKKLIPALLTGFREVIRSTSEVKITPQESMP